MKTAANVLTPFLRLTFLALGAASCAQSPASPENVGMTPLSAGTAASVASAGQPQQSVCHFDNRARGWMLLSAPAPAVEAHLAHHDDALPGGVTPSGTQLGADCALACPCFNADEVVALFQPGPPTRTLAWGYDPPVRAWIHDLQSSYGPWLVESYENYVGGAYTWSCVKAVMGSGTAYTTITRAQNAACVGILGAAQARLGLR